MEDHIQEGKQWLEKLLNLMRISTTVTITNVVIESTQTSESWLTIDDNTLTFEQINSLIGDKGETIDAIQYLANTLLNINKHPHEQSSYTIELHGHRLRRQTELFTLAQKAAQQVRQTGQELEIKDLSSAERKQIHSFLERAEDVMTESRGQEPDRRLIVRRR